MISIPAKDLDFRSFAYLCMGANGDANMEMEILDVRVDQEVADSAKTGTLLPYKASTSAEGQDLEDSLYSKNGGTTFDYDTSLKQGSITNGSKDGFDKPVNLLTTVMRDIPVVVYILGGLAGVAVIISIVIFIKAGKKRAQKQKIGRK